MNNYSKLLKVSILLKGLNYLALSALLILKVKTKTRLNVCFSGLHFLNSEFLKGAEALFASSPWLRY